MDLYWWRWKLPIQSGLCLLEPGFTPEAYDLEDYHGPCLKLLSEVAPHCCPHSNYLLSPTLYCNPSPCIAANSHSLKSRQPKAICHFFFFFFLLCIETKVWILFLFLLEYSWLTMLCYSLLCCKVNHSYIYIYLNSMPFSHFHLIVSTAVSQSQSSLYKVGATAQRRNNKVSAFENIYIYTN